jgi:cysteine-S-conjugate beta-lyase
MTKFVKINIKKMHYNFDEIINRTGTNSLKYDGKEKYFGKNEILPMWVADMDFRTPDFIVEAIKKRASHEIYGYSLKSESFYTSVINWMQRRHKWSVKQEWISFTPGVVSALNFGVLAFSNPGDNIIIQTPVYFPFFTAIKDHGRLITVNQLKLADNKYVIDFDDFESRINEKTKVFILCNPHNPVGRVWNKEELLKLGNICIKNNITIIADEIHSDLIMSGYKHIPLATVSDEIANITITCMAPSKTFNTAGLASSIAITTNPELKKKFEALPNSFHISSGNLFGITALEAAYSNGDEWLNQLIEYLEENITTVEDYIHQNIPEIKVIKPEGTYMIWLDCRMLEQKAGSLKDFFINKAKVGFNNGTDFGSGGDGFMRMNIGCPRSIIIESLEKINSAVRQL